MAARQGPKMLLSMSNRTSRNLVMDHQSAAPALALTLFQSCAAKMGLWLAPGSVSQCTFSNDNDDTMAR
jgi:hypothetical protein